MPTLLDLTPAEYYVLLAAPAGDYSTAIMLTIKDLSLKDVIDIRIEPIQSRSISKKVRKHAFVYTHSSYTTYQFKPHEGIFMKHLQGKDDKSLLFNWLRRIYQNLPEKSMFGKIIRREQMEDCFKRFGWGWMTPKRNKTGDQLLSELKLELHNCVEELKQSLQNDPVNAYNLMTELNGYLYLIPPSDLSEIIYILANRNEKILQSSVSDKIYNRFLEMEKIKEFDSYYHKVVRLVEGRRQSSAGLFEIIFGK